jgi:OmcA/MtrC family decaheme c-type cytochrome
MKDRLFRRMFMALMLLIAVIATGGLMIGCAGSDGSNGANGANGANGTDGKDLTQGTIDAGRLTFDDLRNTSLDGKILSVDTSGNQPVVTFQVINKATGEGIAGLRTFSLHIAQVQPEVNSSNSYWLNYITSSSTSTGSFRPTTDPVSQFNSSTGAMTKQGYSVVDNLDGTYAVTFASNIKSGTTATWGNNFYNPASATFNANLPHRVVVGVRSVAVPGVVGKTPGAYAGPINPITGAAFGQFTNTNGVNLIYDFVPATGAVVSPASRDIVTIDRCNQCHYKLQYGSNNTSGHFGSRTDTKTCVMCHTPQNVVTGQESTTNTDFTPFIHKIHMGERLPKLETNLTGTLNEVTFPQDIRNCTMCHQGALADAWKKPTMKACGSCHNNISFVSPPPAGFTLHSGGSYSNDSGCATICHPASGGLAGVTDSHLPIVLPDPTDPRVDPINGTNTHTNAEYIAAAGAVPTGAAKFTWVISSVTVTNGHPAIKFKFKQDGTDVVFTAPTSTASELMPNFAGSPSAYFVWAETQDGITAPADFNKSASVYIRNVWNGTIGAGTATISGPDGSGYYTIVRTGTTLGASAVMLTGGIGYSYGSGSPPLVQINLTPYPYSQTTGTTTIMFKGGLAVPAPNVYKVATGYTGRRIIVDTAKCNACHAGLGVEPTFHVGQRNDGPTCSFCHNPGRASQGWAVNANTFVHAIHGAAKRTVPFTWDATSTTGDEAEEGFFNVTYPGRGMLKNCEMCHVAGGYDFSSTSIYTAAQSPSNMLLTSTATGTLSSTDPVVFDFSPYVQLDTNYGIAGAGTNLVNSPISAACFACHDTDIARSHMESNGGTIYDTRANALTRTETCLVCHGPAANTAYGDFVPAIKSVHRWW